MNPLIVRTSSRPAPYRPCALATDPTRLGRRAARQGAGGAVVAGFAAGAVVAGVPAATEADVVAGAGGADDAGVVGALVALGAGGFVRTATIPVIRLYGQPSGRSVGTGGNSRID
jgi:hypothetical protein